MKRAAIAVAAVATVGFAVPSYAGSGPEGFVHRSYDERPTITHVDGLGPGCPAFVGTFTENRHVDMTAYLRHDVAHVGTVATATVTLRPASPGAVSYRGSYREVQVGVFLDHGHRTRRASDITVGTIHGSDGSTYETVEVAHSWRGSDGRQHGSDRFHCD